MVTVRGTRWFITDWTKFDWNELYVQYSDIIRYLGVGRDLNKEGEKEHYHGLLQVYERKTLKQIVAMCPGVHLELARGTTKQIREYGCKYISEWKEWGIAKSQGQRTDLEKIWKEIGEGAGREEICVNYPSVWCRYRNGIADRLRIAERNKSKEFRHLTVEYWWGETDLGKTRGAVEGNPGHYKKAGWGMDWWDDYCGESTLVLDEYANDVKITKLLGILDGYQLRLPIKGGFTYANWTKVIITSNLRPEELHAGAKPAHRRALQRRIHKYVEFGGSAQG